VVSHEKHRIRLEDIANWNVQEEEKQDPGFLVKQLMACINPFASYVLTECRDKNESLQKHWTLEESIFKNPVSAAEQDQRLKKSSAEMFAIYKYVGDPLLKVKSERYTGTEDYTPIESFFPYKNLLQSSPVISQLSQLTLPAHQQYQMMQRDLRNKQFQEKQQKYLAKQAKKEEESPPQNQEQP